MSDLANLFRCEEETRRWYAEYNYSSAMLDIARISEHMSYLISQHEPLNRIGVDREKLRCLFSYLKHGDLHRLDNDIEKLEKS